MNSLRVLITVMSFLLVSAVASAHQGEPARPKKQTVIHGYVVDAVTGKPIPGVTVSALHGKAIISKDATDAAGYFRIKELPSGDMAVVFDKKGYQFVRKDAVSVKAGDIVQVNVNIYTEKALLPEDFEHLGLRLLEGIF